MSQLKKYWHGALLLLFCWVMQRQASDNQWVENSYVSGFFLPLQGHLGGFFSLFPFSVGDIIYGLIIALMLLSIFLWIKQYRSKTIFARKLLVIKSLYFGACLSMGVYLIFNIFWGNNYNRQTIAKKLNLKVKSFSDLTTSEICFLNGILLEKVNMNDRLLPFRETNAPDSRYIFEAAYVSYDSLSLIFPAMKPTNRSLKPSLWAWLGNYSGFTGYYNPFTFEAQVNTEVPVFLQPYVACHEIAHQLGYAKEMEANFVGYLAASRSHDPFFRYSVYLDLFLYANSMLYTKDSVLAGGFRKRLNESVKRDIAEWRAFRSSHRNPIEPFITRAYDFFLRKNNQPDGMGSYAMVTAFLLAYLQEYGDV